MNIKISKKKALFSVILVIIVVIVFCLSWVYFQSSEVYEFAGTVDKIENGTVFANGLFLSNGKPIVGKENDFVSLQIKVDNHTKITRLALNIPNDVEVFNTKDLKQEESVVNLGTIEKDFLQSHSMGIESLLRKDFFDNNFTAKSLYFRVPIFSN